MQTTRTLVRAIGNALLFAISLAAQTTWIVDAQNGPGTDFTDLPPAVAAASAGDVIVVRYVDPLVTAYSAPTIAKGLSMVSTGGGRPGIAGMFTIGGVPAGEHVIVRGFRLAPFQSGAATTGDCVLRVWFNDGTVHFQDVVRDAVFTLAYTTNGVTVNNTPLITFSGCTLPKVTQLPMQFTDCGEVVADRCSFDAPLGGFAALATLWLTRTRFVLQESTVTGFTNPFGGTAAIAACDATVELVGPGAAVTATAPEPAFLDGLGGTCAGASVVVQGPGATIVPAMQAATAPVFGLGGFAGGGVLDLDVYGHANGIALLSFGLPSAAPVPLWSSVYYLQAPTVVVFDAVVLDPGGRAGWQAQLPAALPAGLTLWLQAASLELAGEFRLTTPAVVTTP